MLTQVAPRLDSRAFACSAAATATLQYPLLRLARAGVWSMGHQTVRPPDDDGHELLLCTAAGFERFRGPILLVMSGKDLIAREFDEVVASSAAWRGLVDRPGVVRRDLENANHTFSDPETKRQQQDAVLAWVRSW